MSDWLYIDGHEIIRAAIEALGIVMVLGSAVGWLVAWGVVL